jgi:hypothetical protein
MKGVLAYMGLSPAEQGTDATNYSWAFEEPQAAAAVKLPQTATALKVAS